MGHFRLGGLSGDPNDILLKPFENLMEFISTKIYTLCVIYCYNIAASRKKSSFAK